MPVLALALEVAAVILVLLYLKNNFDYILHNLSAVLRHKNDLFLGIEGRLQYVQESTHALVNSVDAEAALYEITRELSKSIEETDILNIFKERIGAIFDVSGCVFTDERSLENPEGYSFFRVICANPKIKYFALNDCGKVDRAKMTVLINQLELSLKRYELYSEIQKLSITDGLTGMYVRRYFEERFEQELSRSRLNNLRLAFLLMDVDNFKSYNDTYGHVAGDAVLKEMAKIIKYSLRQIDMCARYGGEEMCLMLPETSREGALLVAERLRLGIEAVELEVFDESLKMTVSIGVSVYPNDGETVNALIDKADKALYQAKAAGKNRVCASGGK